MSQSTKSKTTLKKKSQRQFPQKKKQQSQRQLKFERLYGI